MVRNYRRKTNNQSWDKTAMAKAVQCVISGKMGYKKASSIYIIPRTTLVRYVQEYKNNPDIDILSSKGVRGHPKVFSANEELELVSYIQEMKVRLYGITQKECRTLAYQYAEKRNIKHPFVNGIAGQCWMADFIKRHHSLSLRLPHTIDISRTTGFNEVVANSFYDLLASVLEKYHLTADRVFNIDETGCSIIPQHHPKIDIPNEENQKIVTTYEDRPQTVTVEICVSASGSYLPLMFIFPGEDMNSELLEKTLPGSWGVCHSRGWSRTDIFFQWIQRFVSKIGATKNNPVLLIVDRHTSHTKNIDVIDYTRDHGVIMLCLPQYCTHKLQPINVTLMRPFSILYSTQLKEQLLRQSEQIVTTLQVCELLTSAFEQVAKPPTIIEAFAKTGIWPFNREVCCHSNVSVVQATYPSLLQTLDDNPELDDKPLISDMSLNSEQGATFAQMSEVSESNFFLKM